MPRLSRRQVALEAGQEWDAILRRRAESAEQALAAARADIERLRGALERWTDIIDLSGEQYTAKWGAVTYADAVDDFTRAVRAALAGTVAPPPQTVEDA